MQLNAFWLAAAVNGFLAVALGAFGAHALKETLTVQATDWWRTAVLYQAIHTVPLLALGFLPEPSRTTRIAGILFILGILLFSGSLYAMALSGQRWLGAVTPLGGVALLAAWVALGLLAL